MGENLKITTAVRRNFAQLSEVEQLRAIIALVPVAYGVGKMEPIKEVTQRVADEIKKNAALPKLIRGVAEPLINTDLLDEIPQQAEVWDELDKGGDRFRKDVLRVIAKIEPVVGMVRMMERKTKNDQEGS